jgi:hypothetical protein
MEGSEGYVSIHDVSLQEFFRERLTEQAQQLEPSPQEDTCWYLGNLLVRFSRAEDFLTWEQGSFDIRPLALLYSDALEARDIYHRCLLLQQLGDMALFLGALFPENYVRRGIGQDYFVGMGGSAYDYLAGNARRGRHVFAELAGAFGAMLELVSNATASEQPMADEDILALYARWRTTRNPQAKRRLEALGIHIGGDDRWH